MYTEIVVKFDFNKTELSLIENNVLNYLFNPNTEFNEEPTELPKHEIFQCPRWSSIGSCSSFYHHPEAIKSWLEHDYSAGNVYVFSRSDLKNYDGEIKKFFDWFNTLNCMENDSFIGYAIYEESNEPTIFHKKTGTVSEVL